MDTHGQTSALPSWGTHIPALDGIRGLAILLVMACHFVLYGGLAPGSLHEVVFSRLALGGWVGVDLFFVLSGFLITGILFDAKGSDGYFRNFYMRRMLRIFPLYYGFLALFFFGIPLFTDVPGGFSSLYDDQAWYWSYLANIRFAVEGWPAIPGSIGHFWSLAVEEQFYILWPLVIFLFSRHALIRICLVCIAGGWIFRATLSITGNELAAYVLTPARMDALAVGAFVALVGREPEGLERLRRWALPVAAVALAASAALLLIRRGFEAEDPVIQILGYSPLAFLFGSLVVLAATSSGPMESWLSHPTLRFFGKYSYALYVFHLPLTRFLETRVLSVSEIPLLWGSRIPGQLLFFALAGTASTVLAVVSWYAFESRLLRLKQHFSSGRNTRAHDVPAVSDIPWTPASGGTRAMPPA
jgi:peptidoglycan/LPS O-acetylase OafA/YrhL